MYRLSRPGCRTISRPPSHRSTILMAALLVVALPTATLSASGSSISTPVVQPGTRPGDRPVETGKPADGLPPGAASRAPTLGQPAGPYPRLGEADDHDGAPDPHSTRHLPGWTPGAVRASSTTTAPTPAAAPRVAALTSSATSGFVHNSGTVVPAVYRVTATQRGAAAANVVAAATTSCDPATSGVVVCENQQPGAPQAQWDVVGTGDSTLQGFATDISVNAGSTVRFKVKSTASAYRVDIYRLGYYQGNGARLVTSFLPQAGYPQAQPACLTDAASGLIDCGNWAESALWAVPSTAVSGVYLAQLVRLDNGGASHVPFVVRSDASNSDLLFQTSDTTWQAYNSYGGNSLYTCTVACPPGSPSTYKGAYKVSYNRPFNTRGTPDGRDWLLANEYPMIGFLERNGYDVSYTTGVDSDRRGSLIKNHKVFLSVGHDEYWSADQRANVEAARDAGVNLSFFSGNEVFWKTRWEPGTDAGATAYRTLVTYKDTHFTSPVDPQYPVTTTGTWRDARFSPPADAGRPENALTGTIYGSDPPTNFGLMVSSDYAKLRFWRRTPAAATAAGQVTALSANTLGYEFDTSPDNGFRPAGLINLSGQDQAVQNALIDEGSTVAPRTLTHHLTLYRAPSGALVFGAGTVQWSFGLSVDHDGPASTEDVNMQQATVNLFADMHVQARTRMDTLAPATASSDTTAPTATIAASSTGAVVGTPYTIGGSATDSGGVVAGVEVSVDGGYSWHPANGVVAAATASWSYTFTPVAPGTYTVLARATDDSANRQSTATSSSLIVARRTCPCTLYGATVPGTVDSGDASSYELGVRIRATISGAITGVRFHKSSANTGVHTGSLWSNSGALLATGTFTGETASGWQSLSFSSPVSISANTTYVASYHTTTGHYSTDAAAFSNASAYLAPLLAPADGVSGSNGAYHAGTSAFPTDSYKSAGYGVDVTFSGDTSSDTAPPAVLSSTPLNGSSSVPVSTGLSATFTKPYAPSSLAFTLTSASGAAVTAKAAVTQGAMAATLTPSSPLAAGTSYTASVLVSDAGGHAMSPAATWTFRTGAAQAPPGICPCTVWSDQQQPTVASANDPGGAEFGIKLKTSANGYITGVRFFKGPQNSGVHTGELWSSFGTLLASGQFTAESTSGWQQLSFRPAVPVTAGTTYIASYHTNVGYYAANAGYFATSSTAYGPLTALQTGTDGGNGVYTYGPAKTFPTSTYGSANYWVDAVYQTTPPPPTPAQVVTTSPGPGTSSSATGLPVTATFDQSVQAGSLVMSLQTAGGATLSGSMAYDDSTRTAAFTPTTPLSTSTGYTATVSATTTDGALAMTSPYSWSFTTPTPATCPCTLFSAASTPSNASSTDTTAFELGVRFTSDQSGYVSGVRFYKGSGNTGTHTGSLWTPAGQQIATGTFTGETISGWQSLVFDAPAPVTAGAMYVVSYHTDTGHYSYDAGAFNAAALDVSPLHAPATSSSTPNGVYGNGLSAFPNQTYGGANYWVTPVFTLSGSDTVPPHTTAVSPTGPGALTGSFTTATFSEPIDVSTLMMTVSSSSTPTGTGTIAYDAPSRTASFTPSTPLPPNVTFTATARAADTSGNLMPQATSWSFTTIAGSTLLGSATPTVTSSGDPNSIELGVRFTADRAGQVAGVRFYKGPSNTGMHTGTLWSSTGTTLATGTFQNESAGGWQTLLFPAPVAVTAGTVYTASYHAPNGNYSYASGFFVGGRDAPPLHASADNGSYQYGAGGLPTNTYNSTNYYVDVIFQ